MSLPTVVELTVGDDEVVYETGLSELGLDVDIVAASTVALLHRPIDGGSVVEIPGVVDEAEEVVQFVLEGDDFTEHARRYYKIRLTLDSGSIRHYPSRGWAVMIVGDGPTP